jgi:hypothetical protein
LLLLFGEKEQSLIQALLEFYIHRSLAGYANIRNKLMLFGTLVFGEENDLLAFNRFNGCYLTLCPSILCICRSFL